MSSKIRWGDRRKSVYSVSSRLDRWYVSALHADWVRNVILSVPRLAAEPNGITIRIGAPRRIMRVCKPRRVHPVLGCAKAAANRAIIAALENAQSIVDDANSITTVIYDMARRLAE